jgi:hypothetical protein
MLPKFFASWLVLLVIAPFTAPFSTCDFKSLFGSAQDQHVPAAPATSVALTTDAAVPTAPFVSAPGRVRLLPLSRVPLAESATPSLSATLMSSAASAGCNRQHAVLNTILRV